MAKKKDQMASRLAAISAAKPVQMSAASKKKRNQRAERTETYRFATLIFDGGAEVKCILKDISSTGAKVIIEGKFTLPRKLTLKIDMTGLRKSVHVVWQDDTLAGLAFIDTRDLRQLANRSNLNNRARR